MSTVVADRAASFMSGARDRSVVTPAATVVRRGRGDDTTVGRRTGSARTIVWASSRPLMLRLGVCVLLCGFVSFRILRFVLSVGGCIERTDVSRECVNRIEQKCRTSVVIVLCRRSWPCLDRSMVIPASYCANCCTNCCAIVEIMFVVIAF